MMIIGYGHDIGSDSDNTLFPIWLDILATGNLAFYPQKSSIRSVGDASAMRL